MNVYEIRDPDDARRHLLQGLLLSRSGPITPDKATAALAWAMEIVSDGSPLPPLGFVADVGFVALGAQRSTDLAKLDSIEGLDHAVTRRYEDYVLGKLYADISFERASDALLRYQGRDRDRCLAYIVGQQRSRCGFDGVMLSPAVIKSLQQSAGQQVCQQAWQCLEEQGLSPPLLADFETLIRTVRNTGELLGPEDIFELESGTALAQFGQRLALRQVLQMAAVFRQHLPKQKPRSRPRQYSVATNIMEEDHYPIGGFTSISNKGTVESMVRSELAYIDPELRPDLFDIKFARNELLYYSRDENQFLRRRLSFLFLLHPSLTAARLKDPSLPCQRMVLLLACLYVSVDQLTQWLGGDAIRFEFLFVHRDGELQLADQRLLLETLFRDQIVGDTVSVDQIHPDKLESHCAGRARTSLCHSLSIGCEGMEAPDDLSIATKMLLDRPCPTLVFPDESGDESNRDTGPPPGGQDQGIDGWKEQLDRLLRFWV